MAKRVSKASLVRSIKALEEEIEEIHRFHSLPVRRVTDAEAFDILYGEPGFIRVENYGLRYCLHPGEIGCSMHERYVLVAPLSKRTRV